LSGHHDDHHHHPASHNLGRAFALGVALNVGFVAIETTAGLWSNSLALLADAGHNLSDVLALLLAWGAATLSARQPSARYTFGLRSSSVLAALANALLLLAVCGALAWDCHDARPGHRRERHRDQELRIVREAGTRRRRGPALVEDELAQAVRLHVERRAAHELLVPPHRQVLRVPPGPSARAPRVLERRQPGRLEERRPVRHQRVPGGGRKIVRRAVDAYRVLALAHAPVREST